jgi:hypothetical protein
MKKKKAWGHLRGDPCVYCAVWPMPIREPGVMTLEHVTPVSAGGRTQHNLVTAHTSCNYERNRLPLLQYWLVRQRAVTLEPPQFQTYRLPDGRHVEIDATAAKGNILISFTRADGRIVDAMRVDR